MNKIFRSKAFVFSFLIGFASFFFVTDYIDKKDRSICFDCGEKFGFPFHFLETGGQVFDRHYLWFGLIADVLIAVIFSFIIGLIFTFLWLKILSHRLHLKNL
jgi:hypothetical protein